MIDTRREGPRTYDRRGVGYVCFVGHSVKVVTPRGWVDWPTLHDNGTVAWEFPGRVSDELKAIAARYLRDLDRCGWAVH